MRLLETFKTRTRNPLRPRATDIITRLLDDCAYEHKGDCLVMGEGRFGDQKILVVAQQKPKPAQLQTAEALKKLNWGMLNADEHSEVLRFLRHLTETGPHEDKILLSIVDTYGADISMYSARRLQAFFIGHLIRAYLNVPIRTISLVLGEGGSGGALALQVADRRAAVEDALYATAPPESVAAIIFRNPEAIEDALAVSRCTAKDLKHFGVVDTIVPMAKKVTDADELAKNVGDFLEKATKDLMRKKLDKLLVQRMEAADQLGVMKSQTWLEDMGKGVSGIMKVFEKGLKHFYKPAPGVEIISEPDGSGIQVGDDYGDGLAMDPEAEYVRCGRQNADGAFVEGCGALVPLDEWLHRHQVCPQCGRAHVLDARNWINALADAGSFHEIFRNLTVEQLLNEEDLHEYYRKFLDKQEGKSAFRESMVTGRATVHGFPVLLALSEFYFAGGTMGAVFGEKFRLATEYALMRRWPLVSVCCSGGARLYEGVVALMQMTKTVASVERLKRAGLPYISILADPATGGAIASYAALGDVCLAEPGAMVIFTGPRVMKARGFEVDENLVRSDALLEVSAECYRMPDYYGEIRGVQEVVPRTGMRRALARYLEVFARTQADDHRGKKKGVRPYTRLLASGSATAPE